MRYVKQDITTVTHGMVGHGCNCRGVMGSGVALAIRKTWQEAYLAYLAACADAAKPVDLLGTVAYASVTNKLSVANIFTQLDFGKDGRIYASVSAIREGVLDAAQTVHEDPIRFDRTLYLPKIGCGLGGLDWEDDVRPVLEDIEQKTGINIVICEI